MSAHDRAVDHGVLMVGIGRHVLEHSLPHASFGPAAEAGVDLDPTAEPLRQIAPRDTGAEAVECPGPCARHARPAPAADPGSVPIDRPARRSVASVSSSSLTAPEPEMAPPQKP